MIREIISIKNSFAEFNLITGQISSNGSTLLTTGGFGLDMAGADITMLALSDDEVKAIISASGSWRVDEEGNLVVKKVTTDELQITDSKTGELYCVRLAYGEWEKIKGVCDPDIATSTPSS